MFNHLESLGTQESPVKVDLLHLDPTDPDGGCCYGKDNGGHCCGRHSHTQEQTELKAGLILWKHRLSMAC